MGFEFKSSFVRSLGGLCNNWQLLGVPFMGRSRSVCCLVQLVWITGFHLRSLLDSFLCQVGVLGVWEDISSSIPTRGWSLSFRSFFFAPESSTSGLASNRIPTQRRRWEVGSAARLWLQWCGSRPISYLKFALLIHSKLAKNSMTAVA